MIFYLLSIAAALLASMVLAYHLGKPKKKQVSKPANIYRDEFLAKETIKKFIPAPIEATRKKPVYDTTPNLDKFWFRCKRNGKTYFKKSYLKIVHFETETREGVRFVMMPTSK